MFDEDDLDRLDRLELQAAALLDAMKERGATLQESYGVLLMGMALALFQLDREGTDDLIDHLPQTLRLLIKHYCDLADKVPL